MFAGLQPLTVPQDIVVDFLMVKGLFSFLLCGGAGINQYAGQETWTVLGYYLSPAAIETLYCHTIWECVFMFLWENNVFLVKDALSALRQFLATESPLKLF